jgi:hypothetical protein
MLLSTETRENRAFAYEVKFRVPAERATEVLRWARRNLDPDPHGIGQEGDTYRTSSLYFDTRSFDVYRRIASFGRSKYRVRRYSEGGRVFLERKLKTRDLVSKRRSAVDWGELDRLALPGSERGWDGFWFHRRILARGLKPVCQISYERTARVGEDGSGPIRLTLDREIRASPVERPAYHDSGGVRALEAGIWVLELKYRHSMPARFKRLLGEFGLTAQPVSKYRMAIEALGCAAAMDVVSIHA